MSCNGCRVLRKGCNDNCLLRPCLQWIDSADAQGNATVFVAKFFGRAGLMGFITAVPEEQRAALFQSLLYEACGRTVNPVHGALGLLWSGKWSTCEAAVETVLKGGSLRPQAGKEAGMLTLPLPLSVPSPAAVHASVPLVAQGGKSRGDPGRASLVAPARDLDNASDMSSVGEQGEELKREALMNRQEWWQPAASAPGLWLGPRMMNHAAARLHSQDLSRRLKDLEQKPRIVKREYEQIASPVARRVQPRLNVCSSTASAKAATLELNLALNSFVKAKDEEHHRASCPAHNNRLSSPSSASVNSECSVTSLDTSSNSVSPFTLQLSSSTQSNWQLLPLLR